MVLKHFRVKLDIGKMVGYYAVIVEAKNKEQAETKAVNETQAKLNLLCRVVETKEVQEAKIAW